MKHILLIGSGAVGSFYASRIPSSYHVHIICRSNYDIVKSQSGINMNTRNFGNYLFKPYKIYPSIKDAFSSSSKDGIEFDYILIATKNTDDSLVNKSSSFMSDLSLFSHSGHPTIVLIQNGIDFEGMYQAIFPNGNIILTCVTTISAAIANAGTVIQYRWTRISIGPYSSKESTENHGFDKAVELQTIFNEGGITDAKAYSCHDIQMLRWHKLVINASYSPTAILSGGYTSAELVLNPITRHHLKECMNEVWNAARIVLGREFPPEYASIDAILTSTERNIGAKPSMLLDWEQGHSLELKVILGNTISLGEAHGAFMPRLSTMYTLLQMQLGQKESKNKSKL